MTTSLVKLFGTEESPAQSTILQAGPLSVELDAGNLRYIRYQGHEALRAVSYVVRDEIWGTFNPRIEGFQIDERSDGFTVSYEGVCAAGKHVFRYQVRIAGSADGSLRFEATGTASTDFVTNRTGFVVLHPIAGVAGRRAEILHVDGRRESTTFPQIIDPKQPMMDMRALTHEVAPGLEVTCTMEGDIFEMEDQRNWTDASYKTYVRPLSLPQPYTLAAGEPFEQAVHITFSGRPDVPATGDQSEVSVTIGGPDGRVPEFGMTLDAGTARPAREYADSLGALSPRFFSGILDLGEPHGETLADYAALSATHGVPLALQVIVPAQLDPDLLLGALSAEVTRTGVVLQSLAVTRSDHLLFVAPGTVFPDSRDFDILYSAARKHFPRVRLGGGNFVYFTELNRMPPPFEQLDFVCHGTCAIVHMADDRSVTETLECLPSLIASGRALFGDRPCRVGPSAIATRYAPFGGSPTPNPDNVRVTMTAHDPRQRGLLGAAWHLGFGARMAEGHVDSVILGAPVGATGLIHHDAGVPAPGFEGREGAPYPVYHVMRALYRASGLRRLATQISAPREVQALAVDDGGAVTLWLANLTGEPRVVIIDGAPGGTAAASFLDESSFAAAVADQEGFDATESTLSLDGLNLAPYAVVRLRIGC